MRENRTRQAQTAAKAVFLLVSTVVLVWTSYLTVSFLTLVLPESFWMVPYLGLVIFDGGMLGWLVVFLYLAEGSSQRFIALFMTVFNLTGVGLMTVSEIVMGGQTFTTIPPMLGTIAIWGIGIWTFVNVGAIITFHLASPSARLSAAIQDEKDMIVEDALKNMRNRRDVNSRALADGLGQHLYGVLLRELTTDDDRDGIPDLFERPADRGIRNNPSSSHPSISAHTPSHVSLPVTGNGVEPVSATRPHMGPLDE